MFYLLKENNGMNNVGNTVHIPVKVGSYYLGSVLKSNGEKANGTDKAAYLVMEGGNFVKQITENGTDILVTPINSDMVFETILGKVGTSIPAVGAKVAINNYSCVDASTEGSVEVVEAPTTNTVGAKLRVKFI